MLKQSNIIIFPIKYTQGNESKNFRQNSVNIDENILNSCPKAQLLSRKRRPVVLSETGDVEKGGKFCLTCSSPMRIGFAAIDHIAKKRFLREKHKQKKKTFLGTCKRLKWRTPIDPILYMEMDKLERLTSN